MFEINTGSGANVLQRGADLQIPKISDMYLKYQIARLVPINSANTDVAIFSGLPAKYRITKFMVFEATGTPVLGTLALYTAAAAGGTNVVAAAVLTALSATTKFTDMTLAVTADYLTSSSLYVRNVAANAGAVTVSVLIEYIDLTYGA